jgi:hypothetical protein
MSIESTNFGVTRLSKKDADKFRKQVSYGRSPKAASASLKSGRVLLGKLDRSGHVKVRGKKAA